MDHLVPHALQRVGCAEISLKPEQLASISSIVDGKDVFLWLPTGFGKSICYEVLPFVFDKKLGRENSVVIIISPLLSLMTNQVRSLRSRSVKAASSASDLEKQYIATEEDLATCSHLFEALECSRWREAVKGSSLSTRVAVDEAHCLSKWCHDFRPSYGRVHEIRALVPKGTPFIACTATATHTIQKEVMQSLEMTTCECISASPDRPNICYEVLPRTEACVDLMFVLDSLKEQNFKAPRLIVYCRTLDTCAHLYARFHHQLGENSYFPPESEHLCRNRLFHSCTPTNNKHTIMKSLADPNGTVRVVFATFALGMGVNLRNVNTIIHYGAPQSIDAYFQESGRGGRSGDQARSVIYWKRTECPLKKHLFSTRDHEVAAVRRYLENNSLCGLSVVRTVFHVAMCAPNKNYRYPSMCICA